MTKPMLSGNQCRRAIIDPKVTQPGRYQHLVYYNHSILAMGSLRLARAAVRATRFASARPLIQQRGYADVAADKIQLSLTLPHQVYSHSPLDQDLVYLTYVHELMRTFRQAIFKSTDVYVKYAPNRAHLQR